MLTFTVEIEELTAKSVTVLIKKSAPEVKIGQTLMRTLAASALCDRLPELEYKEAHRMTQLMTEWNPRTKQYDVWGWKLEKPSETERRVKITFPDDDRNLFKKQPDGSYAASFADLFNRK
jgi:hypothetical protein